jgi:hypothetical protein
MTPKSLLAAQKLSEKLMAANALQQQITALAAASSLTVPTITTGQVVLSSASPELGDMNIQLTYPRVCIYSNNLKNTQFEKFRSFSGQVSLVAEIWASDNLATQADAWIHFYVESVGEILQSNIGDWGDGMFYGGAYDVVFQPPKPGGLGFVESAKLTLSLNVSVC